MKQSISSKSKPAERAGLPWNPWLGLLLVVGIYLLAEVSTLVVGLITAIWPIVEHWSKSSINNLLNSTYVQFAAILAAEAVTVLAVIKILKHYKLSLKEIGLRKPKWDDPLFGLMAVPVYYIAFGLIVYVIGRIYSGIAVGRQQDVGFNAVHGAPQLILTFISLAILPPIAEEILFRGFLYSSMKKALPKVWAVIVVSAVFASAHLIEGVGGPLWVGAIQTFVLSVVLIQLREISGGLWASMTLHGINNSIAYYVLYITPLIKFH